MTEQCTRPHYVIDHSGPEPHHPENVDCETDPSCPIHGHDEQANRDEWARFLTVPPTGESG